MGKRQTLTFAKPGVTSLYDMTDAIAEDMDDMEFVTYIRSLTIPVDYYWDDDTDTVTVVRVWNNDSDYNQYLTDWGTKRTETEARLQAAGYTLTEEVEDL